MFVIIVAVACFALGLMIGPIIVVGLADGEDGPEFTHCNLTASQVRRMLLKEG